MEVRLTFDRSPRTSGITEIGPESSQRGVPLLTTIFVPSWEHLATIHTFGRFLSRRIHHKSDQRMS